MKDSVARFLRTPPDGAIRLELGFGVSHSLRCESYRSTIVICNCTFYADTVAVRRMKANIFERPSILFRPRDPPNEGISGGVAGYRPRVRTVYYMRVYHHIPRRDGLYIGGFAGFWKGCFK